MKRQFYVILPILNITLSAGEDERGEVFALKEERSGSGNGGIRHCSPDLVVCAVRDH